MLERTIGQLLSVRTPRLDGIIIGAAKDPAESMLNRINENSSTGVEVSRSEPGPTRAQTVLLALQRATQACDDDDWILIHDAARPLVRPREIEKLISVVGTSNDGGLLGWPVVDSLARADEGEMTTSHSRDGLWRCATPQMFRLGHLRDCLAAAIARGDSITDEASIMQCSSANFKITTPEDFDMAQQLINATTTTRVGTGFDVHALVGGRRLILGGVEIEFDRGLDGHSDADVLLHAIADACLGAAAMGDIGRHFPDSDDRYAGADSRQLLRHVVDLLGSRGFAIINIDATVIAQAPKLAPYIARMVDNIANDCGVATDAVNVKATTTEGLGFTGRGQGIAAQASVSVAAEC